MKAVSQIDKRLSQFKSDLKSMPVSLIVQKHITFGDCYVFKNDQYFELKSEIAGHFNLHPSEILLVGSGKLGFSIGPNKRFNLFGDKSDIDIAIVSTVLFDKIWQMVFDYSDRSYYWLDENQDDFEHYLFTGWIRPDKLPTARKFQFNTNWWEYFRILTRGGYYGPYNLTAGVYKSWYYLEKYQSKCIRQCQQNINELL